MKLAIPTVAALALLAGPTAAQPTAAPEPLETLTARLPEPGAIGAGGAVEVQLSDAGTQAQVPLAIRGGVTRRIAIGVDAGASAAGFGDLEATLIGLVLREGTATPAIAIAAQAQIPTARDAAAGTGRPDYSASVIASKRIGPVDLHANLGYQAVSGQLDYAIAARVDLTPRVGLFAELLRESRSLTGATDDELMEATTSDPGEASATAGVAVRIAESALISLGASVDDGGAVTIRPGVAVAHRF